MPAFPLYVLRRKAGAMRNRERVRFPSFFAEKGRGGLFQTPYRLTFSVKKYMMIEYKNGMVAARKSRKRGGRKRKYR